MKLKDLTVLVLDGGGRGHALYQAIARSPLVSRCYVAPGNAGIPQEDQRGVDLTKLGNIIALAKELGADLIVAGSEVPLCAGLFNAAAAENIAVFGPSRLAAMLEGSKIFAMDQCSGAGVPTPRYLAVKNQTEARIALHNGTLGTTIPVVKLDGLAAGKGVKLPKSVVDAEHATYDFFLERRQALLLQERLEGREISALALCDGVNALPFVPACDYKRLNNSPDAPNTGGMGAYAPDRLTRPEYMEWICESIFSPILKHMRSQEMPYHGILYAGLMLTSAGPKVLEFNCRFGDPECQVLLALLESDVVEYMLASLTLGGLATLPPLRFKKEVAVCKVLAAKGYPGVPVLGVSINGVEEASHYATILHAGTKLGSSGLEVSGGRVLNVVATAENFTKARALVETASERIYFDGMQSRDDIAEGLA